MTAARFVAPPSFSPPPPAHPRACWTSAAARHDALVVQLLLFQPHLQLGHLGVVVVEFGLGRLLQIVMCSAMLNCLLQPRALHLVRRLDLCALCLLLRRRLQLVLLALNEVEFVEPLRVCALALLGRQLVRLRLLVRVGLAALDDPVLGIHTTMGMLSISFIVEQLVLKRRHDR